MMNNDWCGVQVCISYAPTGRTTTAVIKDMCPDAVCPYGHMDTTPAVWDALGIPTSMGLVTSGVTVSFGWRVVGVVGAGVVGGLRRWLFCIGVDEP
ncbi:hypothetical protein M427DRAFT_396496 [Gonapodya prolifera JEL478]|uniref:RlpA-like protein double-psi beta-barrel domain-containing protein n=1 Tax=Gonapodya prolifera (strain JEL478) TaxID=1344416 RepID=A0A139A6T2_GONPJ|nr:hypothetical protein M427DRAFT_396496 [Gonapodya prolifera JEL478]|eukprot:KXS12369.1 hypothetical protein M427DRAFT_396496 [Gonapodya prolifera JEL478]